MSFNFSLKPQIQSINLDQVFDFVTIGGGPASLNAALYAKRKGLKTLLIAEKLGGNLLNTDSVENYLGFNFLSGEGLAEQFENHLKHLEVDILSDSRVDSLVKEHELFILTLKDGRQLRAKTVNISTGSYPRPLNVEGEEHFKNSGVAYCAICDAPLFKGKDVVIAGGGNSAVEAALDVAKLARKVFIIHRSQFRADAILIQRLSEISNIQIELETQIMRLEGASKLETVVAFDKKTKREKRFNVDGIFIEIGSIPNSSLVKDWVDVNDKGEIIVDEHQQSSIPGLFASGDVTQIPYKQIILAVADGAKAALSASEYLNTH